MSTAIKTDCTPEDLLTLPDGDRYELVDGRLVERHRSAPGLVEDASMGWLSDLVATRLAARLTRFCDEHGLRFPPDLAVEVLSPNDLGEEVEQKVLEYLRSGLRLVWVISPATRTARVVRADGTTAWLREDGELDGEKVVPGFRCRLADLFPTALTESPESPQGNGPVPD